MTRFLVSSPIEYGDSSGLLYTVGLRYECWLLQSREMARDTSRRSLVSTYDLELNLDCLELEFNSKPGLQALQLLSVGLVLKFLHIAVGIKGQLNIPILY